METLFDLAQDLRYAFRMMRKSAFASITIVLCLGFSIGATGTVFAWTESTMVMLANADFRIMRKA